MKKEQFIEKSLEVHGSTYGYELLPDYWRSSEKVTLVCKTHGNFSITASNHIYNKYGCPVCNKEYAIEKNKKDFIIKSVNKFGDSFEYRLVEYVSSKQPVKLLCKKHHLVFSITPNDHLTKSRHGGCEKCKAELETADKVKKNSKIFLDSAVSLHGDKFDYSLVEYVNAKTKVKIRCVKHDLVFETTPDVHCRKNNGKGCCPLCHKESMGQYHKLSVDDFIKAAKKSHGDKYIYSSVTEFKNAHCKVPIICRQHGIFYQTVTNHIHNNFGCAQCGNIAAGKKTRLSLQEFIGRSVSLYGDRFDYSSVVYDGYYKEVKIFCNEHQHYFYQQPANHLHGVGCKECIDKGYSRDKSGYIYINKVCDNVIKVGITNICPIERAKVLNRKSTHNIVNLFHFYHEDGNFIYGLEQHILRKYPTGVVDKTEMLSGHTETISSEYLPEIIDTIVYHFTNITS